MVFRVGTPGRLAGRCLWPSLSSRKSKATGVAAVPFFLSLLLATFFISAHLSPFLSPLSSPHPLFAALFPPRSSFRYLCLVSLSHRLHLLRFSSFHPSCLRAAKVSTPSLLFSAVVVVVVVAVVVVGWVHVSTEHARMSYRTRPPRASVPRVKTRKNQ